MNPVWLTFNGRRTEDQFRRRVLLGGSEAACLVAISFLLIGKMVAGYLRGYRLTSVGVFHVGVAWGLSVILLIMRKNWKKSGASDNRALWLTTGTRLFLAYLSCTPLQTNYLSPTQPPPTLPELLLLDPSLFGPLLSTFLLPIHFKHHLPLHIAETLLSVILHCSGLQTHDATHVQPLIDRMNVISDFLLRAMLKKGLPDAPRAVNPWLSLCVFAHVYVGILGSYCLRVWEHWERYKFSQGLPREVREGVAVYPIGLGLYVMHVAALSAAFGVLWRVILAVPVFRAC